MPKPVPADSLDRLLSLLATQPQGIGIDALARAFLPPVPRRTLQRWLARLVAARKVEPVGSARALRYRCASYASKAPARVFNLAEPGADSKGAHIPVSSEGEEVRAYVRRPREQRRPVGYTIAFLEQYHPNRTHYLPDALRRQLHQMGRSSAQGAAAGTFARDILSRLLIDLSWASSRLEGNTYSLLDTERLFRFGHAADGKDALETQMILNHKAAIEYLVLDPPQAVVSARTIIALHALLSDGLMADPRMSGRLRSRPVGIGGSTYMPLAIPQKIEELFGITVGMAAEITDPFEQAFFLMVHLPYLQPFEDVNKRVSRLAANIPLIRHNLSPLSFIDMPVQTYTESMLGVYELNRVELLRDVFVHAYERSCQQYVAVLRDLVPPDPFRLLHRQPLAEAVRAIVRGNRVANAAAIRALMPASVARGDRTRFVALVEAEFDSLHEGNAVRFGLSPAEFTAWRKRRQRRRA